MASQQLQVYKDPSIVKNVPTTDLERLQLALDAKAPGYQMTPTSPSNAALATALAGGKDTSQLPPTDQANAYGPGGPGSPPGLSAINSEIGNNPWYAPGLLSAYMRSGDKDNFFDSFRPGGSPPAFDMDYTLRGSPDLRGAIERSSGAGEPPLSFGGGLSKLFGAIKGFPGLFGGHGPGTPPIGSQTLRSGLSALFANGGPGEPTSRSIMDAERNRVAAADPRRGQTVQTNNNGAQVVGQRLNNSNRGMTVTGDNWFNSVRGL